MSGGYYNGYRSKVINAVPKISGNFKVKVNTNVAPLSATLKFIITTSMKSVANWIQVLYLQFHY